jgi:hypothetical protein
MIPNAEKSVSAHRKKTAIKAALMIRERRGRWETGDLEDS